MSRRVTQLTLYGLVFCLSLAGSVRAVGPAPIGWWKFNDSTGTTAIDSSSGKHDGTLTNAGGMTWAAGKLGGALTFDGVGHVSVSAEVWGSVRNQFTITVWAFGAADLSDNWFFFAGNAGEQRLVGSHVPWGDSVYFDTTVPWERISKAGQPDQFRGQWHHWTFVRNADTGQKKIYFDGQLWHSGSGASGPIEGVTVFRIGAGDNGGMPYKGVMDDWQLYDVELTSEQIKAVMLGTGLELAGNPSPGVAAVDVPRDSVLSWTPGPYAAAHDVYFGTRFDDVNTATIVTPKGVLVSQGQTAAAYDLPGVLAYGQTYYWRVDEVNAPDKPGMYKGETWSFTAEPYGYPVKPTKATASSSMAATMGPDKTLDGSGLDALGQHSSSASHMWLSKKGLSPVWIQYEFNAVYKLHQMWVWNSNQAVEQSVGFGAKDVVVETSLDGATWTALANVPQFNQASGEPNYVYNTTVDFAGIQAKFVKLTIKSNWADGTKQAGLAEVRFFYVPVKAFGASPETGTTGVAIDAVLNWRPGREAARHEVYVSVDANAVATGTGPVKTVSEHSLALSPLGLEYGTTYTWKVNEVNDAATPKTWEGDLWTFTTPDYGVVDDFEGYDDACKRIFFAWVDGFGYSASTDCGLGSSTGNGSGSTVGNVNPPFAERKVVHGGKQAMPLAYDNSTGKTFSEATRTFEPGQDWTLGGAKILVIYFRGSLDNGPGQLYLKVNGIRLDYSGGPGSVALGLWKQWNIDLASIGTNLKAVKTLSIGVSGSGKGTLYIDDVLLYRAAPAVTVPTDPGAGGLSAWYKMEADVKDSSGKANNGAAMGTPAYVDSAAGLGKALQFEGIDDYVELPIGTLMGTLSSATFATWVNWSGQGGAWQRVFDFGGPTPAGGNPNNYMFLSPSGGGNLSSPLRFAIRMTSSAAESAIVASSALPTGWHHVAVVIEGSSKTMQLYLDGSVVASGATLVVPKDLGNTNQNWLGRSQWTADGFYNGMIDEFRIYSRTLSAGEIRYLAGDR